MISRFRRRKTYVCDRLLNRLKPNDPYRGRTVPLTSKRCILYIYLTNIGTEYFKHGIYSPLQGMIDKLIETGRYYSMEINVE